MLLVAIKILQGHYPVQSICSAVQSICVGEITWQQSLFLFPQQLNKNVISFIYKEYISSEVQFPTYHRKKKLEVTLSFN